MWAASSLMVFAALGASERQDPAAAASRVAAGVGTGFAGGSLGAGQLAAGALAQLLATGRGDDAKVGLAAVAAETRLAADAALSAAAAARRAAAAAERAAGEARRMEMAEEQLQTSHLAQVAAAAARFSVSTRAQAAIADVIMPATVDVGLAGLAGASSDVAAPAVGGYAGGARGGGGSAADAAVGVAAGTTAGGSHGGTSSGVAADGAAAGSGGVAPVGAAAAGYGDDVGTEVGQVVAESVQAPAALLGRASITHRRPQAPEGGLLAELEAKMRAEDRRLARDGAMSSSRLH